MTEPAHQSPAKHRLEKQYEEFLHGPTRQQTLIRALVPAAFFWTLFTLVFWFSLYDTGDGMPWSWWLVATVPATLVWTAVTADREYEIGERNRIVRSLSRQLEGALAAQKELHDAAFEQGRSYERDVQLGRENMAAWEAQRAAKREGGDE